TQDEFSHNITNPYNSDSPKFIPFQQKQKNSKFIENKNGLFQFTTEFGRRQIIPPCRRKTVTGVNLPKILNIEHSTEIKPSYTKTQQNMKQLTTPDLGINMIRRQCSNLSKPQSISHLTLNEDHFNSILLNQNNNNNNKNTQSRWRPWIAQQVLLTPSTSTCNLASSSHSSSINIQTSSPTSPIHTTSTVNCLEVLVMNEEINQLQALNYPIRPNMTARELNNLIAFQMRIFDSNDFGLFVYINGTGNQSIVNRIFIVIFNEKKIT
ncbi:unnamed protein product, partial [Schistosoma turkestanicum]